MGIGLDGLNFFTNESLGCMAGSYTDLVWKCVFYVIVVLRYIYTKFEHK